MDIGFWLSVLGWWTGFGLLVAMALGGATRDTAAKGVLRQLLGALRRRAGRIAAAWRARVVRAMR